MPSINDFLSSGSTLPPIGDRRNPIEISAPCNECGSVDVLCFKTDKAGIYSAECQTCDYKKDLNLGFIL
jgi:hypothetical protein